jgi:hypothetical protein
MGTAPAGATDPREPALGSNPSAGAVPERPVYVVPLSLEDPRRRSRATKSLKNPARTALLCAVAVILMLAMAGGVWFWSGNKEVWEEEKRIGEMVEAEKWEEIHNTLKTQTKGPDSKKLREWEEIAKAIARYGEIAENPQQFVTIVRGSDTVDEAIKTIRKEWEEAKIASSETLREKVEDAGNAANDSAKTWSKAVEKVSSGSEGLRNELKKYSDSANEPVRNHAEVLAGSLETVEAECATWDLSSLESADDVLAMVRDSILPAFSLLAKIDRKHPMDADLNEPADRASKSSERLAGEGPKLEAKGGGDEKFRKEVSGVCNKLIARLGKLSDVRGFVREEPPPAPRTLEPPKPDPAVTAAAEAKKDKIPPKTILINAGTDGDIDFSTIEGAPPTLPGTFEIFPLSSLVSIDGIKGQMSTRKGNKDSYNYYDKDKVILRNPGELKLKKELEAEFWKPFRGGFILCIPKGGEGHDDVRYVVLDTIPVGQVSTSSPPFIMVPCSSFLKRLASGEVAAADDVMRILARTESAGEGSLKYQLRLGREFPVASGWVEDPSQIKLPLATKVDYELSRVKDQKAQRDDLNDFESSYAKLGEALFPQFFEPNPGPGEKVIVDKKNPGARKDSPKVIKTFAEFVDKESVNHLDRFTKYVAGLFNQLNELAGDDSRHASANADFQRLIKSPRDLKAEGILTPEAVGWIEVTKLSKDKNNNWGDSTATSASVSLAQTKANEDQIRNEFQKKYFNDFFRVWNKRFSEEAVKKLVEVLKLIESTQALPSLEQLDSKLKALEATKSRLENADLTDDGEYTLELMLETPNPASPEPFRQIIPLIRGTR